MQDLGNNPMTSPRSKRIDVMHHLVREHVARGEVELGHCTTEKMVTDSLTRALGRLSLNGARPPWLDLVLVCPKEACLVMFGANRGTVAFGGSCSWVQSQHVQLAASVVSDRCRAAAK
ncbi:hypothetical protein VaNZ11_012749 [Volvox africanus]|uniref:Uncharacterized protein n=1 Tax=Volvox africanus TaxID=51714 RepID=A0ABQ5SG88_9CHLO|nr:hypothetical protein VaNZ11_012749 [Volvox africanus]